MMRRDPALAAASLAKPIEPAVKGTLLLVDDEPLLLRAFTRIFKQHGYEVEVVSDGEAALALLATRQYDAMFCDLSLPGTSGLDVMRQARVRDPEMPIVLVTGAPSLETAIDAVTEGAIRYLVKPVESTALAAAAADAVRRRRVSEERRRALEGPLALAPDSALLDRAMASLYMAYQPIVRFSKRGVYAYEALLRTQGQGLPHAGALVDLAQQCGRLPELGQRIRAEVARVVPTAGEARLFVNLHPVDFLDEELYDAASPLAQHARRVVLEVTERAGLDEITDLPARLCRLRALGYRIAVDDLGEGYAGLTSLARLEPQFVKLDMSLVRNIDQSAAARHIVRSTVRLCRELRSQVIAEGVETPSERDALLALGCDFLQGYLFGRPSPQFGVPVFGAP